MTNDQLRIRVAELMHDDRVKREGWIPYQQKEHRLLYGGHDAKGLWIYQGPDGFLHGCNYETQEGLRNGEIKSLAARFNFPESLDAANAARRLSG